ncbi:MAG: PCRF domain-containing protein, partial [Chlorobiaceae bacterium]|nr:PCRF domain-containing protein [Chlorobiaceae bacterium]
MNHKRKDCRRSIVAWNSYGGIFDVDERKDKIYDLEKISTDPAFWNDQKGANKVLKELSEHKSWTEGYEKLHSRAKAYRDELEIAEELGDESFGEELTATIASIEQDISAIEFRNMLSGKDDAGNALITIHAGAGGTEAQDWAEMLYRMYMRWAERKGFKIYT